MVRSGCASALRPKVCCPCVSKNVGIGHTISSQFVCRSIAGFTQAPFHASPEHPLSYARGWRICVRHPLNDPTPAGATDARVGVRYGSKRRARASGITPGRARGPSRWKRSARGGDGCRRNAPNLFSRGPSAVRRSGCCHPSSLASARCACLRCARSRSSYAHPQASRLPCRRLRE